MISQRTKERILESARIEEVVGDFVKLKKKTGAYILGLCPFHHEKTPSFTVTPDKGIYKCFGCGKAGDSIGFIMEHEKATYPEALRYLAKKYHIEIEEDESPEENAEAANERESLFVASSFAQKFFTEQLTSTDTGKAIGLSYFKERGFSDETISKFQLGYSPESWDAFSKAAVAEGYQPEYLVKTGLSIQNENSSAEENKKTRLIDRFRGRVMFPIHNLSGRVIGFGGRILGKEIKVAKYLNSPDSDIYHKSQVLYGIYFAKKEIISQDNCFLVEGYTDVISMHQSGVENVVSSSGTSLTNDQIRLISRYTKNITVLYDGDAAGIKASLRGIDMILEEGLKVRIVLFPDGDDPDSYARKHSQAELKEFITKASQDFIMFKAGLLMKEAGNDPVKKAELIRDIVESIAKVPDPILRSEYIKECSARMNTSEQVLISETNKAIRALMKRSGTDRPAETSSTDLEELLPHTIPVSQYADFEDLAYQERDIIRILLTSGDKEFTINNESLVVSNFIIEELHSDNISFDTPMFSDFYREFIATNEALRKDENKKNASSQSHFLNHQNSEFNKLSIDLVTSKYVLSENWKKMHKINVPEGIDLLTKDVLSAVYALKKKKVLSQMDRLIEKIKSEIDEAIITALQIEKQKYDNLNKELAKIIGTVVPR